jgi:hypothetical protein
MPGEENGQAGLCGQCLGSKVVPNVIRHPDTGKWTTVWVECPVCGGTGKSK